MQRRRELRVTHLSHDGPTDVVVSGECGSVGELAHALRGSESDLVIDGRPYLATATLDTTGVGTGSVIGGPPHAAHQANWRLLVVGGPASGSVVALDRDHLEVGRSRLVDDPTVSGRHFVVTRDGESFAVVDAGSTNSTLVDGEPVGSEPRPLSQGSTITAGATRCRLDPGCQHPPHSQRDRSHHRPPRRPLPPAPPPIELPPAPSTTHPASRFSWAAVVAPLILGLGMAVLFDWRMAAFALLSPLLGIGTWLEDKRRARHDRRAVCLASREALAHFRASLATTAIAERLRREALLPGAAACVERARSGAPEVWERRQGDADFGQLRLGNATLRWQPEVTQPTASMTLGEAMAEARSRTIVDGPVGVSIAAGEAIGICGDATTALAVARSLVVQAAVLHGPADLAIAVSPAAGSERDWGWVKWLPHHQGSGTTTKSRRLLAIVGGPQPAPGYQIGGVGDRSAIVIAPTRNDLPAWCTQIVAVDDPPLAALETREHPAVNDIVIDGVPAIVAEEVARALAPLIDPEAPSSTLTGSPTLLDVVTTRSPQAISERWAVADRRHLRAPIGFTGTAPLSVDLVTDGPHSLVAGTTGSGKSELLRTWVTSLATAYGPDLLTFFLVDYKGGSAFDACARLPHVVGSVTDLDDCLAERALVSLDAELAHRERRLRRAGVTDINDWPASGDGPMPRLVIVIDEFAALQRDLPHFMDALVQIAQRGRSLGVHLVLATQRPQGVVSDSIRANTNLRICLRVQDPSESHDVIGAPDAAALTRAGTAIARIGNDAIRPFEVAYASAPTTRLIDVRPFRLTDDRSDDADDGEGPTQLMSVVDAIVTAAQSLEPPRRPWLPPLPTEIDLTDLPAGSAAVADDPANQQQRHWLWAEGPLLLYGTPGSGTTTALRSLAVAAARAVPPDELNVYALDFGAGGLNDLALLPHTGAVVAGAEAERVVRCVTWLHDVVRERQRTGTSDAPRVLVLVDGWSAFASSFDTIDGIAVRDRLLRVATEGASVGVDVAVSGESPIAVPTSLAMAVPAKVVFRLADRYDYAALGLPARDPFATPGACVETTTGLTMQFATPTAVAFAEASRWPVPARAPVAIEPFPTEVKLGDITRDAAHSSGRLVLPLGQREDGQTATVELGRAEHVLVIGRRGTGRSTALSTLASSVRVAAPEMTVLAISDASSPLSETVAVDRWIDAADRDGARGAIDDLLARNADAVVLVDDAERCAATEALELILEGQHAHIRVCAATRPDALRTSYGNWLHGLRSHATLLVLEPGGGPEADALVGRPLPRRPFVPPAPGRGELVSDGDSVLVQVALP